MLFGTLLVDSACCYNEEGRLLEPAEPLQAAEAEMVQKALSKLEKARKDLDVSSDEDYYFSDGYPSS
jgi:hypothetical protein